MASKIIDKKSLIHGRGIFSAKDIKRGEVICVIKGTKFFKVNKNVKDALSHPDWVGFKMNNWVDPAVPFKYLNHSCIPNSAVKGKVTLVALRDIKKGEEVTIDYSIIEADFRWHMKCHCGNKNCRGVIKSIQWLPREVYNSYCPYISKDFQRVYEITNKLR